MKNTVLSPVKMFGHKLPKNGIQHLIVFGDSLSDNGFDNVHGFQRYSNGKVWPEYLAKNMAFRTLDVRAWGGATSGMGNYRRKANEWSGLLWQIQNYAPVTDMESTLVVIEIGTNDLHDPSMNISPSQVVNNLSNGLKQLNSKRVKHIILWNLNSNIEFPGYIDKEYLQFDYYNTQHELAKKSFEDVNKLIDELICHFNANQKELNIALFDVNSFIKDISTQFENITTPWLDTDCYPKKMGWLWFDHWHFMTETHSYIADHLFESL